MKNETSRKLNMEEKRKLEKLLFADIERAEQAYNGTRSSERDAVAKRMVKNAPAEAVKLFATYKSAKAEMEGAERALDEMGYDINTGYGTAKGGELGINYAHNKQPAELASFDRQTSERKAKLAELKRSYTLKLFAGGAEAQELFASLAKEIAKLTA